MGAQINKRNGHIPIYIIVLKYTFITVIKKSYEVKLILKIKVWGVVTSATASSCPSVRPSSKTQVYNNKIIG